MNEILLLYCINKGRKCFDAKNVTTLNKVFFFSFFFKRIKFDTIAMIEIKLAGHSLYWNLFVLSTEEKLTEKAPERLYL